MTKFPPPPAIDDLRRLGADVSVLPRGTWLWRVYFRKPPERSGWNLFRSFGPVAKSRFDHHLPPPRVQERSILYAAFDLQTCLAEVFQTDRTIDTRFNSPWLVGFAIGRDVRMLNLTGTWPTAAGASTAINSGPRQRSQAWSRAIYDAYPEVDGMRYGSSMNANRPSFALYERAEDAIPPFPVFNRSLADPALDTTLTMAANVFGYDLI